MPHVHGHSAQTAAPLADRSNDRLVELRPLVDEMRFEFIDVSNFGAINFLLQNTPDDVVDRVEVWRIWRPQCRRYEVKCLLLQERDGVACSMCYVAIRNILVAVQNTNSLVTLRITIINLSSLVVYLLETNYRCSEQPRVSHTGAAEM